jgi:hypothetical protein
MMKNMEQAMKLKLDKMKQRVSRAREHIELHIGGTSSSIMADLNMPMIFLSTSPQNRVGLAGARDRSQSEKDPNAARRP